ncbi:bifunctional diguanylate cyclase/phosphodiesterase [uncultured Ruminococcus sp.]|uniref:putative bifunctional diguanylate cyclase/phosphodiesterase n=1 Tax=uncultured Ruminococcus sp. TaxID=165186 RepID=UPI0025CE773B|nr:GGDEF domain-containing phosphodiesterase [uncultured Ruminococcus sp.]
MDKKPTLLEKITTMLGLRPHSEYVKNYFYDTNMRASIYMSVIVIVLEIWMIIRLTKTIIVNNLQANLSHYIETYYSNYFILLGAGVAMFVFAVMYLRGKTHKKSIGLVLKWFFSVISIYFGVKISINDYSKGEQILTFLTMELFVVCLLTWRPVVGFGILTTSYVYFFMKIDGMTAVNTGEPGLTLATQINSFTMWLSTMMFCISNYNKTLSQALKEESLEKVNSYLSRISIHDELTGIHNMVYFRSEAQKLLNYVTTDKEKVVFLFFDIENFKSYNEKYGFRAGNELLVKVANMIVEAYPNSLVSRFSDDHFVVLTKDDGSEEVAERLSAEVNGLQDEVHLQLKCGAYKPEGDEADPSLACDRARFACNSIKKHFYSNFRFYDKTLEDKFQLKQYIVNSIDNAIASDHIKVFYQPVVSTKTGEIVGLEALARWNDPKYGLLPPAAFIEILEEYRQIHKLDICIIDNVCRDYRRATDSGEIFVPVSLNFSRLDFELCDIVGELDARAKKYNVPPEFLDIEITESALTDTQNYLQKAMKALRSLGYKVWLDDFGSGYSSMNVLKDYSFDVLKIDMKFLRGFENNPKTRPIIQNIVNLTQTLDMVSLTEGVETREQFDFLASINCDRAQGYLFSKPVPLNELCGMIGAGDLKFSDEFRKFQK